MSSTELTLDNREIEFALKEWLHIENLSKFERFKDFDVDTIDLLVKEGHKFALEVMYPSRSEADRTGCKLENGKVKVPACIHEPYKKAYELGWASLKANPEFGGQGAPQILGMALSEGIAAANLGLSMYFGLTEGAAHLIEVFGTEALRQKYCQRMYTGEFLGSMCLSEPHAGSDVGASTTVAEPTGDGRYKIKGTKCWISGGASDLGKNTIHTVLARIKGAPEGTRGLSLFVVPTLHVADNGSVGESNDVEVASIEHKMGINCSSTCVLNFGENNNCYGWLLGEEGKGMANMFQLMNEARMGTATIGLALSSAAYQNTLDYAKERIQGSHINNMREADPPKVAIIEHPDVRLNLLNMKCRVEAIRALLYASADLLDISMASDNEKEKEEAEGIIQMLTPMCKAWATEVGLDVVRIGIQVLGGVGYTKDFPLEQFYRDLRITAIYEGTTGIQALDLIGRKMTMKNGAYFMLLMGRFGKMAEENSGHPVVGPIVQNWIQHCETLSEMAMGVQEVMTTRGMEGVALYATPFLMYCSSVTAGYFLLQQSLVVSEKLEALKAENNIGTDQYKAFLKTNSDALFYDNKLKTISYFVDVVLPQFESLLTIAKKRNFSPLDISL
ncbi:MAG: acyl-CoA dehydrogenase [SAR324 cluster bacterium]|nr:acyl-CoA dehydrogenase [SAR324 cluster bacterium]